MHAWGEDTNAQSSNAGAQPACAVQAGEAAHWCGPSKTKMYGNV